MKPKYSLRACLIAAGLVSAQALALAQTELFWTGTTGGLFDATKWNPSQIPDLTEIVTINNGGTATIPADAGTKSLSGIRLGSTQNSTESGHIIMNGGTLNLGGTAGDPKAVIGFSTTLSTFIQNGGTIFFDGPDQFPGSYSDDGLNGLDWEVGEKGMGRFEMHNDAKFFAGDDLKVGANGAGMGSVLIDGNAHFAAGSGISVSEGGPTAVDQVVVIAGNARVDAGNSLGAGNPNGSTDEGYLTMAAGADSTGRLTVQDNAVLKFRRLSARQGNSFITVKDRGQIHIFDLIKGDGSSAEQRPAETGPNSTFVSQSPGYGELVLQDDAVMTVNSDPASGPTKGLGISAPRDAGNAAGTAKLIIRDRASFRVEQNLEVGTGAADTSDGTVTVIGPNAKVTVVGDLKLAVDPDGNPTPGKGTVNPVITGASHATINVTGVAKLANGTLKVKLDGYAPIGGESYTLIKGGTVEGQFVATDLTEAVLGAGLSWKVDYSADSVVLKVEGGAPAQTRPGLAEANGLTPLGPTVYVNPPASTQNNGKVESLGVGVIANGNVVVGWEDDGDGLTDQEAVWTVYSPAGVPLTPVTTLTTIDPDFAGQTHQSRFLAYFRADGSAVSGRTAWGPKIKVNPFGDGFGMGGTAFDLGKEVVALAPVNNNAAGENAGDFPAVQLLNNSGAPLGIVSGLSEPYAERDGDVRIGDWDYLANGNLVIVGESRQRQDLVDVYGGAEPKTHGIVRVVKADGSVVKAEQLLGKDPIEVQIWHGSAVTANGFVIRYAANPGGAKLQRFDNNGNKVGDEIDLATLTGSPIANGGGRGEEIGLHGNGKDAYVLAVKGTDTEAKPQIWVTVFNADGTKRWARNLGDSKSLAHVAIGRVDAAIDESGRVAVVYSDKAGTVDAGGTASLVLGRLFDAQGNPIGNVFSVSEKELPAVDTADAFDPRIDWRGNTLSVAWESKNQIADNPDAKSVVALRTFNVPGGVVTAPTVAATRNPDGSITLTYTGTLIGSDTINGTYSPVAGASGGTFTVTPGAAAGTKFYRSQN